VQRKLGIDATEHHLHIAGREVKLSAPTEQKICDSEWLVMNTRGLASESEARAFGEKLKSALEISSVASRVGVDAGRNLPTASLGREVRDAIRKTTGGDLRPNIHGLDVFPDDPKTGIFAMSATGVVRVAPDPWLSDLDELHRSAHVLSQRVADVIVLLNYALIQPQPVAQIVFAVAAVESLGQDETWTAEQKTLLAELGAAAMESNTGTEAERAEVAAAIRKGLHRLTLRQGVFRLLDRLQLAHLRKPWDSLYAERSTLVHGLAPRPDGDYGDLAHRTVSLCGQILLKAIAAEVPQADRHVAKSYLG